MKRMLVAVLAAAVSGCGQDTTDFEVGECCACPDDDDDGNTDDGLPPADELYGDEGIGSACECQSADGETCKFLGVPVPTAGREIGCESLPEPASFPGANIACMPSFEKNPNAELRLFFANGYCTLYAAKCEGTGNVDVVDQLLCANASVGDYDSFTVCPQGSALVSGVKPIIGRGIFADTQGRITYRLCAPLCTGDSDCRGDEIDPVWGGETEYQCLLKNGVRLCIDPRNFDDHPEGPDAVTVEAF